MTFKSRLASSEPPTAHTEVIGRATGRQTHLGEASVYVTNIGRHDPEGGDGGVEFDLHAPNRTAGNTVSRDRPPPGPRSVGGSHVLASDATQRVRRYLWPFAGHIDAEVGRGHSWAETAEGRADRGTRYDHVWTYDHLELPPWDGHRATGRSSTCHGIATGTCLGSQCPTGVLRDAIR